MNTFCPLSMSRELAAEAVNVGEQRSRTVQTMMDLGHLSGHGASPSPEVGGGAEVFTGPVLPDLR